MCDQPEHTDEVEAFIERHSDAEDPLEELPAAYGSIIRIAANDVVSQLRVSWVVERAQRAWFASSNDQLQNATNVMAACNELHRRVHRPVQHPSTFDPSN
jgi:hypothetical protein